MPRTKLNSVKIQTPCMITVHALKSILTIDVSSIGSMWYRLFVSPLSPNHPLEREVCERKYENQFRNVLKLETLLTNLVIASHQCIIFISCNAIAMTIIDIYYYNKEYN